MSIHGDAKIGIVAIDSGIERIACKTTPASSTLQVLGEGGHKVKILLAEAFDGEIWSLVLG